MKARVWMLVSATVVVGVLTGCEGVGSGPEEPPPSRPSGATAGSSFREVVVNCALVPASMVNAALGTNVGEAQEQLVGHGAACRYAPVGGGRGNVVVRIQADTTRALFDQGRAASDHNGIPTVDLPGFEDAAYTSTISAASVTTNTVVALRGRVQVLVSSGATFDMEKSLEQQIFATLA
jgi:hypothetical protein